MCEMKYSNSLYTITRTDIDDWQKRVDDFLHVSKTKYSINFTLITPYRVKENENSAWISKVITLYDLMR